MILTKRSWLRIPTAVVVGALLALIATPSAQAVSSDGTFDSSFNQGTGFNGTATSFAAQADDKLYVTGSFTSYNGTSANRIVKLNADGTIDGTFDYGTGFNNLITSASAHKDANGIIDFLIVGGRFTTYKGTLSTRLAKILPDGTASNFTNSTIVGDILFIKILQDQSVVVGLNTGATVDSTARALVKFNSDGTLDSTFASNIGSGPTRTAGPSVTYIGEQSDSKILVGGLFDGFNGTSVGNLVRLNSNGTIDGTYSSGNGTGLNSTVQAIAIQSDNKAIIVGSFSSFNGSQAGHIIRLGTDGSRDSLFNGVGTGFTASDVYNVSIATDGKVLVTGGITQFKGVATGETVRLNADGSLDSSFMPGELTGIGAWISELPSGDIVVSGTFTTYNGNTVGRIARLTTTTPVPLPATPAASSTTPAVKLAATGTNLGPIYFAFASGLVFLGALMHRASLRFRRR